MTYAYVREKTRAQTQPYMATTTQDRIGRLEGVLEILTNQRVTLHIKVSCYLVLDHHSPWGHRLAMPEVQVFTVVIKMPKISI